MADFSLALINRTGAYHICHDLLEHLPERFDKVRYWRLFRRPKATALWKIAGRMMLAELALLGPSKNYPWPGPRDKSQPVLFMDPLYVLRADLKREDIVICHDVGPITHPELFDPTTVRTYRQAYAKIAAVNPGIVVVSEYTRKEYQRLYGTNSRFIVVCHQYVRLGIAEETTAPVEGINGPFLLTIGAQEKRKNHLRIIEAYRRSGLHERGVSYVYCGSRGVGADDITAAARRTPGVISLGYVTEDQLRWLFRNASGMVLPSLLEGFGLPPLEAAQEGLVSVVSKDSVQEEAMDGNAIMVDPYDVDSIAKGMVTLVDMSPADKEKILAGARAHAASMSFERYIGSFNRILECNGVPDGLN